MRSALIVIVAGLSLLLSGAIAGFFYAYSSSVMFGLDAVEPRHAIRAMQGINAEVRNAVFAPAFFLTPVASLVAAVLLWGGGHRVAALFFLLAALAYVGGAFLPTMLVSVPMNEALATASVPADAAEAAALWQGYSRPWQWWNGFRTLFSLFSLLLLGAGLFAWGRGVGRQPAP